MVANEVSNDNEVLAQFGVELCFLRNTLGDTSVEFFEQQDGTVNSLFAGVLGRECFDDVGDSGDTKGSVCEVSTCKHISTFKEKGQELCVLSLVEIKLEGFKFV